MLNVINFINYYILLYIIINNSIQQYNCYIYKIQADKKESNLDNLNIENSEVFCEKLIPSLFYPILFLSQEYTGGQRKDTQLNLNIPFSNEEISAYIFTMLDEEILNGFKLYYIKLKSQICYFGLSMGYPNDTSGLNENEMLLSMLKIQNKIDKKVFSFDKFILNEKTIDTNFYFGEIHENFTSNDGIIGTCKSNEEDNFWGCSFNEMIFNNKALSLKKEDNKLYKIYLKTDDYDIIIPKELISIEDMESLYFERRMYYGL